MKKNKIKNIILKRLVDGKLPCAIAFQISKEFDISLLEIGQLANEKKIKIKNCQLGCF